MLPVSPWWLVSSVNDALDYSIYTCPMGNIYSSFGAYLQAKIHCPHAKTVFHAHQTLRLTSTILPGYKTEATGFNQFCAFSPQWTLNKDRRSRLLCVLQNWKIRLHEIDLCWVTFTEEVDTTCFLYVCLLWKLQSDVVRMCEINYMYIFFSGYKWPGLKVLCAL